MNQNQEIKQKELIPVKLDVVTEVDRVVLTFEKEISWIGLTPEQALRLAENLKIASITVLRSLTN